MAVITPKKWNRADLEAQGFKEIVIGVPGRPFPVMVPNPHAMTSADVFRLEVIEDTENPIVFWSQRNYDEVVGMLYRFLPTPSMLPLFYETLRLLRLDNDRRIQFYIGRHGSGKSFAGKLIGDLLHPDGSITVNCADRDLNELLFETVLDVSGNPDLYRKINEKLKRGEMSPTSIAALRKVVGDAYHDKKGYPFIDFAAIGASHFEKTVNEEGLTETETVFSSASASEVVEAILKIAEVEGLSSEASFMPLKSQLGILPRTWEDGRVVHLEEYNKCKEGTDTCLHPVLQTFNGENSKCRVFGTGGMSFAFDNKERRPGFFCYMDGNMQADGVATHTLSASANDRLLPNIIQDMIKDDWKHRWSQLITGLPIPVLYECNKEQWDADPDSFTRFLQMIRGLGGTEVPPLHRHYINRWEDVLEAVEMIAQYNYLYDQKTNPDSVFHKEARFPELFTEVDEEFHNMAGGSMRRVIKHFKQAMLARPKTSLPSASRGFDLDSDWNAPPPVKVSLATRRPEITLGTDIVTEFYEDMVRLTLGLGKPNLFASLKADFESLRLKRPDLQEGFASEVLYFEDLLNSQKGSADRLQMARNVMCDQLRVVAGDKPLSDENDFLLTVDQLESATNRASSTKLPKSEDPRLGFLRVQRMEPMLPVDQILAETAILDGFAMRDGRAVEIPTDRLLTLDRFLVGLGMPKVGKKSISALYLQTILQETPSQLLQEDEAILISAGNSGVKLSLTTVLVQDPEQKGEVLPVHVLMDSLKNDVLVVGGPVGEALLNYLKEADIEYVDRSQNNARTKAQIFLNKLLPKRGPEIETQLVASFFHRNRLVGQDLHTVIRNLERHNFSDLLITTDVHVRRPVYATDLEDLEAIRQELDRKSGEIQTSPDLELMEN